MKNNPIKLWKYKDKIYVCGLGAMYTTCGFPLSMSLDHCAINGWIPCFRNCIGEMIASGVSKETAKKILDDALNDMIESIPTTWSIND